MSWTDESVLHASFDVHPQEMENWTHTHPADLDLLTTNAFYNTRLFNRDPLLVVIIYIALWM